jgi:hypothetical protein
MILRFFGALGAVVVGFVGAEDADSHGGRFVAVSGAPPAETAARVHNRARDAVIVFMFGCPK